MISTNNIETAFFAVPAEQSAHGTPKRLYGRRLPLQRPRFSNASPMT